MIPIYTDNIYIKHIIPENRMADTTDQCTNGYKPITDDEVKQYIKTHDVNKLFELFKIVNEHNEFHVDHPSLRETNKPMKLNHFPSSDNIGDSNCETHTLNIPITITVVNDPDITITEMPKPKPTIEFLHPTKLIWTKGNIIEVRLEDVFVLAINAHITDKCPVKLNNIRIL